MIDHIDQVNRGSASSLTDGVVDNKDKGEQFMVKSWIEVSGDEISISLNRRHMLSIDTEAKRLYVINTKSLEERRIDWKGQSSRVSKIVSLIDEAKEEAKLTTAKEKTIVDRSWFFLLMEALLGKTGLHITEQEAASSFYGCLNDRRGLIVKVAKSISKWVTTSLPVDIWFIESNVRKATKDHKGTARVRYRAKKFQMSLHHKDLGIRHLCALSLKKLGIDFKLVKIVDAARLKRQVNARNKSQITKAEADATIKGIELSDRDRKALTLSVDDWLTKHSSWNGDGFGFSIPADRLMEEKLNRRLLPEYTKQGYTFLGGSPSSGLLLFIKNPLITKAGAGQKLAKISLRGGIPLNSGVKKNFIARLVEMPSDVENPSGPTGYHDGIFMMVREGLYRLILNENQMNPGSSFQGHYLEPGVAAMKGMVVPATEEMTEYMNLLGVHDAVVDVKVYNSIYGANMLAGEEVMIQTEHLWVMSTDDSCRPTSMHISAQIIRRAPSVLKEYFSYLSLTAVDDMVAAGVSGDARDLIKFMPSFGSYKIYKQTGLRPMLRPVYSVDSDGNRSEEPEDFEIDPYFLKAANQKILTANAKGFDLASENGRKVFWQRLLTDGSLDAGNYPTVSMPKVSDLEIGDPVILIRYPLLPTLDDEGRGGSIFVATVEKLTDSFHIGMNGATAKFAEGDEDGDQVMIVSPSVEDLAKFPGIADCGHANISMFADVDDPNHRTVRIFKQKIEGKHPVIDSGKFLSAFMQMCANVGVVDNLATTAMLYLADPKIHAKMVRCGGTPTDESVLVYLAKTIQAVIRSMKWPVDQNYTARKLSVWMKTWLPKEAISGYGNIIKHPELLVAKPENADGRIPGNLVTMEDTAEALKGVEGIITSQWIDMIKKGQEFVLEEDGFKHPSFYEAVGEDLFDIFECYITDERTRDNLGYIADVIKENHLAIIQGEGADRRGLKIDETYLRQVGLLMRHSFCPVERLYIQSMLVMATSPRVWMNVCTTEFLSLVAAFGDDSTLLKDTKAIKTAIGITGNNKITAANKKYDIADFVGDYLRVTAETVGDIFPYVKLGESITVSKNETVIDDEAVTLRNTSGIANGSYTITNMDTFMNSTGDVMPKMAWLFLKLR
jgi:hypothetical protein